MSRTNGETQLNEFYATPVPVVKTLISRIEFRSTDTFLEPCLGTGNIYWNIPIPEKQKYFAELRLGIDYLNTNFPRVDVIGTNPPFSLTCEFLEKSLSELNSDGTLFYLQRLDFLGSVKRYPFWSAVGVPNKLPVIVPRPRFHNGRNDSGDYAWLIYDNGNRFNLPHGISHLKTEV
jgi:hypothetical protein